MAKARDAFGRAAGNGGGRRSGSEKRQRVHARNMRFSADEHSRIAAMEQATGQSFAALVRHALFNVPPPHSRHRPSVDHVAVARLLGELGKIGSNINQIAHHLNAGWPESRVHNTLEVALRDLLELRLACLQALGREPERREAE